MFHSIPLDPEKLYEAIRKGTEDAILELARSPSWYPQLFYSIQQGTKEAMEKLRKDEKNDH